MRISGRGFGNHDLMWLIDSICVLCTVSFADKLLCINLPFYVSGDHDIAEKLFSMIDFSALPDRRQYQCQ